MRIPTLLIACVLAVLCRAQDSTWVSLSYPEFGCTWQMPAQPTILDTLNVRMYALELDSGMAITVHFIKDVVPDTTAGSLYQAAFDVEGDTLRAMAQVMLATSNGQLVAISDSIMNGVPFLDLSMAMQEHVEIEPQLMHLRLYCWKGRFSSFGVTAANRHSTALLSLAVALRTTISIVAP